MGSAATNGGQLGHAKRLSQRTLIYIGSCHSANEAVCVLVTAQQGGVCCRGWSPRGSAVLREACLTDRGSWAGTSVAS